VDAIVVETMTAIEEAVLAIRAARSARVPVVIASMAFDHTRLGARTMMGETPEQAAQALLGAGAAVIGANCGSSLEIGDYVDIMSRMRAAAPGVPLLAQPNAGQPQWLGGRIVYPASPAQFAEGLRDLLNAGASIVGGCCGTTPDYIAAGLFHAPL
jgi:5-methyltetrahydrofolate--homocysteine methyltransferase